MRNLRERLDFGFDGGAGGGAADITVDQRVLGAFGLLSRLDTVKRHPWGAMAALVLRGDNISLYDPDGLAVGWL